jgi:hypothetical protein
MSVDIALQFVDLAGCHTFVKGIYKCQSDGCGHLQTQGLDELYRAGGFPVYPKTMTVVADMQMLAQFESLSKNSPSTSLASFLRSSEEIGKSHGNKVSNSNYFRDIT